MFEMPHEHHRQATNNVSFIFIPKGKMAKKQNQLYCLQITTSHLTKINVYHNISKLLFDMNRNRENTYQNELNHVHYAQEKCFCYCSTTSNHVVIWPIFGYDPNHLKSLARGYIGGKYLPYSLTCKELAFLTHYCNMVMTLEGSSSIFPYK
ncbi:hypothetical protein FF38_00963 [Lucilia cuprina]|uniref:Uncharacterized protein n=1 Tax=Lucilia cuprina TaxID=7375 RepID=A0A0L0BWG8_LUCCU|nr:hypothetical protein FF38_00963 [Lucilia cuprina]